MDDFIPLAIPNITQAEGANLQHCVDTNFVSTVGEFVGEFEDGVAKLSGTPGGVATGAGTLALHLSLHGLGVGPGDLVIAPSFTFIATANAISQTGAKPWLLDIDARDWTLSPDAVERALREETERRDGGVYHVRIGARVAALMPVYTLGTPADMERIGALAEEYGLPIVADAAAAIGVTFKGEPIGPMADLTCYSFNGNKTITCGGGGMIVGPDAETLKRLKHLSSTARVSTDYDHDEIGFNYRMTNLQAAVGVAQLERLPEFLDAKTRIRHRYNEAFAGRNGIGLFPEPDDRTSTCWFSGFTVQDESLPTPKAICNQLAERRIQARTFWKPVHMQVPYADAPRGEMPMTEDMWSRIVTLPCSTMLTEADQGRVIEATLDILDG